MKTMKKQILSEEFRRIQVLAGIKINEAKDDYITLDVKIGDKVKFYVDVPQQNIGTTGEKVIGTVIKINPTTFTVKDKKGKEHKISKTWFKGATYLPSIIKEQKSFADVDEELSDLAKRDYPKEQNAVVRYYLELLHNIEKNYTDDLDDLKNLTTAIGFFHKELINKLK